MELEFHEAANIFPLDEENLDSLAADIKAHGLKVQIELYGGKILDGRRRYLACRKAGVDLKCREVNPPDPIAYVLSLNLHRRQLSVSQLAMVGARAREMYDRQAKERQRESGKVHGRGKEKVPAMSPEPIRGDSREQAGAAVGVGGKSIDNATKVLRSGNVELIDAVDAGVVKVNTAAEMLKNGEAAPRKTEKPRENTDGRIGMGVSAANKCIRIMSQIPKDDSLRKRGFEQLTKWLQDNK